MTVGADHLEIEQINITCEQVMVAKVTQCYKKHLTRLELATKPSSAAEVLVDSLFMFLRRTAEGKEKHGQCPKGKLERDLAQYLA